MRPPSDAALPHYAMLVLSMLLCTVRCYANPCYFVPCSFMLPDVRIHVVHGCVCALRRYYDMASTAVHAVRVS